MYGNSIGLQEVQDEAEAGAIQENEENGTLCLVACLVDWFGRTRHFNMQVDLPSLFTTLISPVL